jgi:hypothetical protein
VQTPSIVLLQRVTAKDEHERPQIHQPAEPGDFAYLPRTHNPVDWYAWGKVLQARARAEDKPIFLSMATAPATGATLWTEAEDGDCGADE